MSDQDTLPPLYAAVIAAFDRLVSNGRGATFEEIGVEAWRNIDRTDRTAALPLILGAYANLVRDEEESKRITVLAADRTHSYLDHDDVAMLWDSALDKPDRFDEVGANQQALMNVLSELELLQHRLAMRDQGGA